MPIPSDFPASVASAPTFGICRSCNAMCGIGSGPCPTCGSAVGQRRAEELHGVIFARTEIFRTPIEAFAAITPFGILLVDLHDGTRLMGHGPYGSAIGDSVAGEITMVADRPILQFERSGDGAR